MNKHRAYLLMLQVNNSSCLAADQPKNIVRL